MCQIKTLDIIKKIYSDEEISEEEHEKLLLALKIGTTKEKIYVARALSKLKNPSDAEHILNVLNMKNETLTLIEAVAAYGNLVVHQLLSMLEHEAQGKKYLRENIIRVFVFFGSNIKKEIVVPIFLDFLNDRYAGVRKACIHGIEKLNVREAIPKLESLLIHEHDEFIKRYATSVLEKLKSLTY